MLSENAMERVSMIQVSWMKLIDRENGLFIGDKFENELYPVLGGIRVCLSVSKDISLLKLKRKGD